MQQLQFSAEFCKKKCETRSRKTVGHAMARGDTVLLHSCCKNLGRATSEILQNFSDLKFLTNGVCCTQFCTICTVFRNDCGVRTRVELVLKKSNVAGVMSAECEPVPVPRERCKIVLKIGSSSLTTADGKHLNLTILAKLVEAIVSLRKYAIYCLASAVSLCFGDVGVGTMWFWLPLGQSPLDARECVCPNDRRILSSSKLLLQSGTVQFCAVKRKRCIDIRVRV